MHCRWQSMHALRFNSSSSFVQKTCKHNDFVSHTNTRFTCIRWQSRWLLLPYITDNAFMFLKVPSGWSTAMRDKVVDGTVRLLCELGQMPTTGAVEETAAVKVGVDAKVEHVVQLLTAGGSNSVVLLHGMGGIGKTTLARAVFNRLHAMNPTLPCSFLRLDPDMKDGAIMQKQQQLLKHLARAGDATLHDPEDGRGQLADRLQRMRVLLVVDNVWGSARVARLLQKGTVKGLLDSGSMVLLTSREAAAAGPWLGEGGAPSSRVSKVEVECLSEEQSLELFCRHAYDGSTRPPDDVDRARVVEAVARCGHLPMAVEVVGLYYAAIDDKLSFFEDLLASMAYAYRKQDSSIFDGEATLFGALRLSWRVLDLEEQEALLDIAWFLKGQLWDWVQYHCGSPVLRRLCGLGLVKRQDGEWQHGRAQIATVHDTVSFFCQDATAIDRTPQRKVARTGNELQEVRGPPWEGARGYLLRASS
jgi:hypothetical protein